ncbi:MAG: MBL fold metallo-hydrolase [Ardenticatenales bacterium]|nr:MBL fold metallo-hydrolase [Ardenticatenales bacterium]
MLELIFLGTSASAPSVARNVTSTMVLYRDHRFLIDAGEGTQRQLLKSGLGFRRLEHVLITHSHLDHILGLAGLVSTFSRWDIEQQNMQIFGSRQTLQRVRDLLLGVVLRGQRGNLWLQFEELSPGPFFQEGRLQVSAFPVEHRGSDSFGFLFEETARRPFLNEQAEALGVPFGPIRARLVAGESITLADGRVVSPDEALGPPEGGTRMAYVGDVDNARALLDTVRDVDALVIEATYADEDAAMVNSHGHITARMAAELAREANVGALYLNHISRRYHGAELEAQARSVFPNTTVVRDLDHIVIKRHTEDKT